MRPRDAFFVVLGSVLALIGLGTIAGGAALLWAHNTQRDADGWFTSSRFEISSDGYALTAEDVEFLEPEGAVDAIPLLTPLETRVAVDAPAGDEVFVGIARTSDLDAYLDGVRHDEIVSLDAPRATTREVPGDGPPAAPAAQDIWVASERGSGSVELTWTPESGRWGIAVMNADASAPVAVEAQGAVRTDVLGPTGWTLIATGLAVLVLGSVLIGLGVAGAGPAAPGGPQAPGRPTVAAAGGSAWRPAAPDDAAVGSGGSGSSPAGAGSSPAGAGSGPGGPAAGGERATGPGRHPLRLWAELDPALSRWQWLVKWLLALPHVFLLLFLWLAFVVLTFVAGLAILFTGRYPRPIFTFNVGVLRWSWRVTAYAFGLLSTDRYPPFTLEPTDYPADLELAYPERLSRGLVLVKWWLLVLPHYLVLAVLTGAATWSLGTTPDGDDITIGGGLVGLLVLIAVVVLLVRGAYPRPLFDLVVGLQRWIHRVIVYAALMTDVYPPFRLDQGGEEAPAPGPPPAPPGRPETRAPVAADH
ncbi:DUF4389 domain-containing protein [Egicoccus sp. AB-alg2]|uniref:DUF4389 domain-containing protein n=1 Tax=Egicoccus sp. AB-alg2 TaxID=3242693 RepID=UPI00359EDAC2